MVSDSGKNLSTKQRNLTVIEPGIFRLLSRPFYFERRENYVAEELLEQVDDLRNLAPFQPVSLPKFSNGKPQ